LKELAAFIDGVMTPDEREAIMGIWRIVMIAGGNGWR